MKIYVVTIFVIVVVVGMTAAAKIDPLLEDYGRLGTKANFYDETYQNGQSTFVETDGPCKNLPRRWLKRPQSVDTRGTCVLVCEEKECQGACKRIIPNVGEQNLGDVGYEKRISSIMSCFFKEKVERS